MVKISRKKANILILILFVMFVSSLLGLLVSQYVSNLIRVSSLFQNYYRGYYHAYAGLELGLAQTLHHGYGFQESHNYNGFSSCSSGIVCNFEMTITSREHVLSDSSTVYTDCSTAELRGDYYNISSGDGLITPLFRDSSTGFDAVSYDIVDDLDLVAMDPELYNNGTPGDMYTVKVLDEDLENYNSDVTSMIDVPDPFGFATDLSGFVSSSGNKNYLIVVNATGSTMEFCMELDSGQDPLPTKYAVISSVGYYGDATVSLGATKVNQLPSYLIYSAIE